MLRAWEEFQPEIEQIILDLPEKGGPIPEFLAEVKWKLDWLLKMQEPDGRVLHKISTTHFGGFINPEDEKTPRYFVPWGTTATADFVGMLAMASRILAPFDEAYAQRCLAAAQLSYDYLVAHPDYVPANQEAFHTGRYESDDSDDRLWAAAELWATSGDTRVLKDLEERIRKDSAFDVDFDWGNVKTPGLITYLFSDRDGRDPELVALLKHNLIQSADLIVAHADNHPYARPLERYYWGCNGTVVRLAHVLQSAWRLEPKMDYQRVTLDAVNHVFGRNVHGRSYVTGLGAYPPLQPHDRRISEDGVDAPWPGYLVGGPHPRAEDWVDEIGDYRTNEIAINWNGALIYALAASLR
jgi:endoglucanase